MRLIDADELCNKFTRLANNVNYDFFTTAKAWVNIAPTVEVQEVKSGFWVVDCEIIMHHGSKDKIYFCNLCEFRMAGGFHKYCPNCGAKMDEGVNDGMD